MCLLFINWCRKWFHCLCSFSFLFTHAKLLEQGVYAKHKSDTPTHLTHCCSWKWVCWCCKILAKYAAVQNIDMMKLSRHSHLKWVKVGILPSQVSCQITVKRLSISGTWHLNTPHSAVKCKHEVLNIRYTMFKGLWPWGSNRCTSISNYVERMRVHLC